GKNNVIVESLEDSKRLPAHANNRISALEDISIYTYDEDTPLKSVFTAIYKKEAGKVTLSHKEDQVKLNAYLTEVLPNYDKERVYASDIKKVFQWYNLLHKANLLILEEEKPKAKAKTAKEGVAKEVTTEEKAVKKPAVKKPATAGAAKKASPKSMDAKATKKAPAKKTTTAPRKSGK
ncbi:MAG: DUF5606 domain-containing protein, partial [Crocinitomicaceae bacterium]